VQKKLAQLTWSHHTAILDKIRDPKIREFYIIKTIENGWSRDVMIHQIEAELHKRQGKIISNFNQTIAPPDSELVQQVFKDKYKFEFVYLGGEATERDLENALTEQITKFLIELGKGFSFVGKQYKISAGSKEYFLDLLFYHIKLKCFVVIELKIDEFKPEYKGKMDFYLNLVDDQLREEYINPSIGLILCKTIDGVVVKYALRDSTKPIGVAAYRINNKLPKEMKKELPSVEELESELKREVKVFQKPLDKKLNKLKELLTNLKNEEVKEKQTPQNTARIFNEFILPLKQMIIRSLKQEIIPLFDSYDCMIWTDSQGHHNNKDAADYLENNLKYFCHSFKIEIQLRGLKKAGKKAFDIWKDLRIVLGNYSYSTFMWNSTSPLLEKLYHQLPGKAEIKNLSEKLAESLLDDINQRLEQINRV
jgi:predicted nuclease of restriction endonuclease-like (RecB) superfamily